jgi:hypothetical protein
MPVTITVPNVKKSTIDAILKFSVRKKIPFCVSYEGEPNTLTMIFKNIDLSDEELSKLMSEYEKDPSV